MMPTRAEAEKILEEAEQCNSGPWVNHSRITAKCAEKIAELCENLDSEKAYIYDVIGIWWGRKNLPDTFV